MRNGYTSEQLDAIEKLMDQLPHLLGMFQAGEDGWEDVIIDLYNVIIAKRIAAEKDRIVNHLKDSLGLVEAELDTGEFAPVWPKSDWPGASDHDHISPSEQLVQHGISEEYQGAIKFTTNSPQVTPTQDAPYPSFLATVVKGLGFNIETTGDGPYTHTFRLPTEISGSLEMEVQVSMDEPKEMFPDPVWPQVSYPEHEKPEGGNFVLVECPSRFEGKRWVPLSGLVFQGVGIIEDSAPWTEENQAQVLARMRERQDTATSTNQE